MIYKTLKKVSDYCQLLDKSKFPATQTVNGVTFTNNGDGSITANGTATSRAVLVLFYKTLPIIRGKGLIIGDPQPDYAFINYMFYNNKDGWLVDNASFNGDGLIFTGKDDAAYAILYIAIEPGSTANNLIFKPQLFDLTEMYGAGNEPTTVEQFRQDFPDEMYDYKPYCFVKSYKTLLKATDNNIITSYKKSLVCKTKNLFDIDSAVKVSGTSTLTKVGNQIIVSQNSRGTYISGNILLDNSLVGKTITVRATAFTSSNNTAQLRIQWSNENGNVTGALLLSNSHSGITPNDLILKGVVPEKPDDTHNNLCLMFYSNASTTLESGVTYSSTYYNIQLELGNTATEYHPYGYL